MSGFVLCVDSPQAQAGLLQAKQQVAKSEVMGAVKSEVKSKVKEVPGKVANEPKSWRPVCRHVRGHRHVPSR